MVIWAEDVEKKEARRVVATISVVLIVNFILVCRFACECADLAN